MEKNVFDKVLNLISELFIFAQRFVYEIYIIVATLISAFLTSYYKIDMAFYCFISITSLDTITRVHAEAKKKGLIFNPFRGYFWAEFKSDKFREMMNKIFSEYGVYLIIAFILDTLVFEDLLINIYGQKLTLPVIALYLFSFIELWSIGENIDDAGGVNIFKKIVHLLPEKVQKLIEEISKKNETNKS